MSRRGIHPLLMGLDRPERSIAPRHPLQTSGLESAQRKRYLRSEAEKFETSSPVEAWCSTNFNDSPLSEMAG